MTQTPPELAPLPHELATILDAVDVSSDDIDVEDLSFTLERRLKELTSLSEGQRRAGLAEVMALQMDLVDDLGVSIWGTRYGPATDIRCGDKSLIFPDIAQVDANVLQRWRERAQVAKHPALRARYADLVWDLTKTAVKTKPPIDMARLAVESYTRCGRQFPQSDAAETRLVRAYEIARSIRDADCVTAVREAMFSLLDATEFPASRVIWLSDLTHPPVKLDPTPDQFAKLISGLEAELTRICSSPNPCGLTAKEPALRLARHYERAGRLEDAKRVVRTYCCALESFAANVQGFVGMTWLQEAHALCLQYGLKEEAERFLLAARAKADEGKGQMVRHRISADITDEEMVEFLDWITESNLQATTQRIAVNFLPKLEKLKEELEASKRSHGLLGMMSITTMGPHHPVAQAGSIDADPEGRLVVWPR